MKISTVIIAFNEETQIAEAIASAIWADEIIVIDSESTDRTREIARNLGAKVIVNKWPGFAAQKQLGTDAAQYDWIFSLDADERVSDKLRQEILEIRDRPAGPDADGYKIPRLSFYMGRAIRHSGWYPDWQLRFFDRRKGSWKNVEIHESIEMATDARTGRLKCEIEHFSIENAAHHHRILGERYAPLAARQMYRDGRRTSPFAIAISGPAAFLRAYVLKLGFLDGFPGYCIAKFAAHHAFLKHTLLWEMQHAGDEE
ncbi:MAG TPA: glycosyltransferase family 2 protein [Pyrinomonadaceae bacterium]|nr:glycosyltransferase family 2 protein [Pyrinomonadaceae bacterium]